MDGSRNYSEEFLLKSIHARNEAKTSLHNTGRAAEIFGGGIGMEPRAPCPTTVVHKVTDFSRFPLTFFVPF
ncbi:hypothetical protein AKJ37_08015 [candidate division MSBL1 archaeon SCGC-AAA259I09]|uniref:Uncharacterized protein n=1 Tax=candidate division MSBL1 archaeon SCGC-AAA259I09 TaxID=1698267 RepID=A0A133UIJ6_9EURY|nr:hypothetical protein AKJ37_08015 [candidate division MSBL1 archaeon SCGC-AAA259I09]